MHLARTLIAGSFAAMASFVAAPTVGAAEPTDCTPYLARQADGTFRLQWPVGCTPTMLLPFELVPIEPIGGFELPPLMPACEPVTMLDLSVVGIESGDEWVWEVSFRDHHDGWCNETFTAEMANRRDPGAPHSGGFTVNRLAALGAGGIWRSGAPLPCDFVATLYLGDDVIARFADDRTAGGCVDEPGQVELPEDAIVDADAEPEAAAEPAADEPLEIDEADEGAGEGAGGEVGEDGEDGPLEIDEGLGPEIPEPGASEEAVPGQEMPHTGSDNNAAVVGLGLLVLGAGLGFTALSLSRRRHP